MRRGGRWLIVVVLALGVRPLVVQASTDVEILLNKLVARGVLTDKDAGEIQEEIKHDKDANNKQLAKEIVPESARNWQWGGDIRFREDYRNRTGTGQDVNRQRIRFRYGFNAKVTDQLKVGARLATGATSDPVSANQSFDTSFNRVAFSLDRAFVDYAPELPGISEFRLTGGIIENPFWVVGQLVWDDDLNFDGAAIHLARALGPVTLFTNDGVFALQTGITEAASLWSAQGGMIIKPFADANAEMAKQLKVTAALAYHDYKNVTNPLSESTALATAGGSKGNSADIQDLDLLNPTFEVASQVADIPVGLFTDWVHNTASGSGNNGFQIGFKAGKASVPFDLKKGWEAAYYFERLDPDATFGAFTDSDVANGGTNHRGHVYLAKLAVLKSSTLQLKYFNTQEVKGAKNHADTFQADWVTRF